MFKQPDVMTLAAARSAHAALRQSAIAENVANADTPGYRARDVADFADSYRDASGGDMRRTRAGHMSVSSGTAAEATVPRQDAGTMSPGGNNVSIENEMVAAAQVRMDHDTALAVYRTSLDILRASLGRR
jgi:flagellar basal-body rod protein FlgB